MTRLRVVSTLSMIAGLLLAVAALGPGAQRQAAAQQPTEADGVRATMQAAVNAWNQGDLGTFLTLWTAKGLEEEFDVSGADVAEIGEFIGEPTITLLSISNIRVTGTTATAEVELSFGLIIERSRVPFLFDGIRWRIDGGFESLSPAIPAGVTAVPLNLQEYAFVYNREAVTSGNFAFQVRNTGVEEHEVVLFRIETTTPLLELLQSEEEGDPEGIEFIGFGGEFAPGDSGNVVFTSALPAGRYGLVCFFPAPDGEPHAFKGMISEFTVGTAAGTTPRTITPPSTGDGGLHAGFGAGTAAALAFAAVLLVMGAGGLALARRA